MELRTDANSKSYFDATAYVYRLQQEHARYKEALERIARAGVCSCTTTHVAWCPRRIAQNALKPGDEPTQGRIEKFPHNPTESAGL